MKVVNTVNYLIIIVDIIFKTFVFGKNQQMFNTVLDN